MSEASVYNLNILLKSECAKIGFSVNFHLRISNAVCYTTVYSKGVFFFNNLNNGHAMVENYSIKF